MHRGLQDYINRLPDTKSGHTALWRSARGQVVARYFHCDLTSVFAPIVDLDSGAVLGHPAYVRGDDASGQGVSPCNGFVRAPTLCHQP